jgi:hypothetical protein
VPIYFDVRPTRGKGRIDQSEHGNLFPLRLELTRRFERKKPAEAISAEPIRSAGLHAPNLRDIVRRHFLRTVAWDTLTIETSRP